MQLYQVLGKTGHRIAVTCSGLGCSDSDAFIACVKMLWNLCCCRSWSWLQPVIANGDKNNADGLREYSSFFECQENSPTHESVCTRLALPPLPFFAPTFFTALPFFFFCDTVWEPGDKARTRCENKNHKVMHKWVCQMPLRNEMMKLCTNTQCTCR